MVYQATVKGIKSKICLHLTINWFGSLLFTVLFLGQYCEIPHWDGRSNRGSQQDTHRHSWTNTHWQLRYHIQRSINPENINPSGSKCLMDRHVHPCLRTTSGTPDQPTCPFMDRRWAMERQIRDVSKKNELTKRWYYKTQTTNKTVCVSLCECVGVDHEPWASHKIQLWETGDLYSRLTRAAHTNICRVHSHLLLQAAQSAPVCAHVCVRRCHISSC